MEKRKLYFVTYLLILILCGCSLEDSLAPSTVEGTVTGTKGLPIEDVTVQLVLVKDTLFQSTDSQGKYTFKDVNPGLGHIFFKKEEYVNHQERITVYGDEKIIYDHIMPSLEEESFLDVLETDILLNSDEKSTLINVYANIVFSLSCEADWIKVPDRSFNWSTVIKLEIEQNNTPFERKAEVIITGKYGHIKKITILQKASPVS